MNFRSRLPPPSVRREWAIPLAVVAAFAGLALRLGLARDLVLDEGYTRALASLSWKPLAEVLLRREFNGALHTVIVAGAGLDHQSVPVLRGLSLLALCGSVLTLWPLLRRVSSPIPSAVGLLFFATNSLIVEYAMIGRSYALAVLLVVLSTTALVRATEHPTRGRWLIYGLLLSAGVLAHLFTVLVGVGHLLWLLGEPRARRTGWSIAWVAAGLGLTPLVAFVAVGGAAAGQLPEGPTRGFGDYASAALDVFIGQASGRRPLQLLLICCLAGAFAGLRRSIHQPLLRLSLLSSLVPLLGGLLASLGGNFFTPRYLLVAAPAASLLVAGGLAQLPRVPRLALCCAIVVGSIAPYTSAAQPERAWSEVAAAIEATAAPGDVVTTLAPFEMHTLRYYLDPRIPLAPSPPRDADGFLAESRYDSRTCAPRTRGRLIVMSGMTREHARDVRVLAACAGLTAGPPRTVGFAQIYLLTPAR